MKSILIYSSEFLPFKGGVARWTEDIATMLADGGFARVVVLTETPNHGQYDDAAQPFRVVRLPLRLFGRPWINVFVNTLSSLAVVLRARSGGFDWLVATGKRSIYNTAFFLRLLGPSKLAVVVHGSEWSDMEDPHGWRRRAARRLCASADIVIMQNRFTIRRFQSLPWYPSEKTRLLHPVVDSRRVRGDQTRIESYRRKYFSEPAFSLITLARLTPRKGQDQVLKALGRMMREGTRDFRYFIVGKGWYRVHLERLIAAEDLTDRVIILEELSDAEAYSLVSLCDFFVMPNREYQGTVEGFGIAFLEANVLGIPVLAGRSGGSTEAVQDGVNGLVCDGDDADDVYRKIRLYHDDPALRARLRAGCRDHVLERFGAAGWKARYQEVFSGARHEIV